MHFHHSFYVQVMVQSCGLGVACLLLTSQSEIPVLQQLLMDPFRVSEGK